MPTILLRFKVAIARNWQGLQNSREKNIRRKEGLASPIEQSLVIFSGMTTAASLLPLRAVHTIEQSQPLLAVQHRLVDPQLFDTLRPFASNGLGRKRTISCKLKQT